MPVSSVLKPARRFDVFVIFVISLAIALVAIEVLDPAPIEIDAVSMTNL